MICRLIEQQQIRSLQNNLCQFDTHPPSSTEFSALTIEIGTVETESYQRFFYFCLIITTINYLKIFLRMRQFFNDSMVILTVIISSGGQFSPHTVDILFQLFDVFKSLFGFLHHGSTFVVNHVLRQVTDGEVFGKHNTPFSGRHFSGYQL
ncbi:hypothetical protein SDC9_40279 [bioreactor metagenome]|uniref:Uncharacterized protein n=1 Tax=bioreactor metagenome TaxID=1076179 RepID=A0A644VRV7_9ZZZZ